MDEEKTGEPTEELEPQENLEGTEETPPSGETEGSTRFDGLSKEDLLRVTKEQDTHIGERNREIGELRTRIEDIESTQSQDSGYYAPPQAPQYAPQPQYQPPQKPEFNWDNPMQSVDERVDSRVAQQASQFMQGQFANNLSRGQYAFQQGKQTMNGDPKLFEGIEKEVEETVAQYYLPYIQQGVPVEHYLTDRNVWAKTAQHIRLNRGEYDKLKPDTSAVRYTATETPGRTTITESSPVLELEPEDRAFAKQMGLTDKQAKEIIERELKEGREE